MKVVMVARGSSFTITLLLSVGSSVRKKTNLHMYRGLKKEEMFKIIARRVEE